MDKEILEILKSEIFKSIVTILLSSGLTFFLTRTTEGKNDRKSIYKAQLEKIFLPLYIMTCKIDFDNSNKKYILYYILLII